MRCVLGKWLYFCLHRGLFRGIVDAEASTCQARSSRDGITIGETLGVRLGPGRRRRVSINLSSRGNFKPKLMQQQRNG